ncbi:MAG: hypothetical protein P4L84_28380 [Isosphaeraceae bacterium]|nr:hypothetical protein [Isosphaeraceae bacterium]
MDDPRTRQAAFNTASCDQWEGFAAHRARVSALLGAGGVPRPTRLCVLGAGNANDLDLPALLAAHREVHLVDLDREALARGAARQGVGGHASVRRFGGIDLTGMLDAIAAWSPSTTVGAADLQALAEWPARRVAQALPGPYDVVASTCVLSQLIGNAFPALGNSHRRFLAVVEALRIGHLRLLARLVAPGGTMVFVTDVVSSDTLPDLASLTEGDLPGLLPRLARERNFIAGVHPEAILSALESDRPLSARIARREVVPPWRWRLHARVYLVWAVRLEMAAL